MIPFARMLSVMLCLGAVMVLADLSPASAQARKVSHCIAIADATPGVTYLHKASWRSDGGHSGLGNEQAPMLSAASWRDPVPRFSARLHYVNHATFLIQTHGGLTAATDFTGFLGNTRLIPDVVTMNHAHSTHWTANPDPAIPHVLRGWGETHGAGIEHYLDLGEMVVRNVSTDIRSQFSGIEENGNSIFVFEIEGLCIGHLGHLHHAPDEAQYAALGRMDVVLAPVDGGYTVPQATMIAILQRLRSSVVIPMHWFSDFNLRSFLTGMEEDFVIDIRDAPSIEVSLATLPDRPTVVVLRPEWLRDDG